MLFVTTMAQTARPKVKEKKMKTDWAIDISDLLLQLGEDLDREGLRDTPERVENAWMEFLEGYTLNPAELFTKTFEAESPGIQACLDIEFTSMCEHHLLPFFGVCNIVYKPDAQVAGLSKLTRLVDCFARRLQIQERMSQQIADALFEHLTPYGVLVTCEAKHLCCHGRGIRRSLMKFRTVAKRGHVGVDFWDMLKS